MNEDTLDYNKLEAKYGELQKKVTRFSAIEQQLVNTAEIQEISLIAGSSLTTRPIIA